MQTILLGILVIALLGTVVAFVSAYSADRRFGGHLRVHHPKVWERIKPAAGAESSASSPFARFLWRREYATLGDPALNELGERARSRTLVASCLLLATVLLGVGDTLLRGG